MPSVPLLEQEDLRNSPLATHVNYLLDAAYHKMAHSIEN